MSDTILIQGEDVTAKSIEAAKRFLAELAALEGGALTSNAPGFETAFAYGNSAGAILIMALTDLHKDGHGPIVGVACGILCTVYQALGERAGDVVAKDLGEGVATGLQRARFVMGQRGGAQN